MTQRVHRMPFGTDIRPEGTRFRIWAPDAPEIALVVGDRVVALADEGDGWREAVVAGAGPATPYGYRVGDGRIVPDPASRSQPDDVSGLSRVVDPAAYPWTDADWKGRPWEEAVIYEVHVGTATREGTFASLADKLDSLSDLGVTAIELLPVADFPGSRNWGYDGVLSFAPDAAYGTPDDLKGLVERAHALGLMVLLDVVYNHFGPSGNQLNAYAGSFFTERHQTPWGAGLNFDGEAGRAVRDFFVHNALYWLEEFHFDGLRFDAVHAILDDSDRHIVDEIATRIRDAIPDRPIHLILENEANTARWLTRDGSGGAKLHNAQWNDDIHHCWHTLLTGESDAYYADYADRPVQRLARCLAEGFAYQGEPSVHAKRTRGEPSTHLPPSAFIGFLQNHDQVGNRAFGERIATLTPRERLALARAIVLLCPQIPMLFMGEEWAASTPFRFFVDFSDDAALSDAIRQGRRQEFAHFAAFSAPGAAERIPDPTAIETFTASKLRWEEREMAPHDAILAETRHLIGLRQKAIVPLCKTRFLGAEQVLCGDRCLAIHWRFEGGDLALAANLGNGLAEVAMRNDGVVWSSGGAALREGIAHLPSWTAIMTRSGYGRA